MLSSLSVGLAAPAAPRAAAPAPAADPLAADPPAVLSDAEHRALAQRFPAAPAVALRLYGPHPPATDATALGGRLDLRA